MKQEFVNEQQKMFWDAFSGKCGEEFKGNPCLMEGFMEMERARERVQTSERGMER